MAAQGRMKLAAYLNPTGHHVASWRHPRAQADAHVNVDHYIEIAKTAEDAKFDVLFLADGLCVREAHIEAVSRSVQFVAGFEPFTLLSALAMHTSQIGLVGTASTSWNEPFHIARKFASLDHISKGRAAWNVVTSVNDGEARNFGEPQAYEHGDRYDRAGEVVEIVKGLWDSWEDDAWLRDRESGLYFEPGKMHTLNYKSDRYSVKGPLNVARPPQGYPVIVQAGASDPGRELAAAHAEMIFSPHLNKETAKEYYDDVKGRMAKYGRDPSHLTILPGLSAFVKATDEEAEEDFNYVQSLIHPMVGREILSSMMKMDLSQFDPDKEFPDPLPGPQGSVGHYESLLEMARREKLTVRQMGAWAAGARGKNTIHGSAERVADYMQEWFEFGACDGFTIMPPYIPGCLDDFVELVAPILAERGLMQTEYTEGTLRDRLGLPRPENRYA